MTAVTRNLLPRLAALEKLIRHHKRQVRALEVRADAWRGILAITPHGPGGTIAARALARVEDHLDRTRAHLRDLYRARATARRASPTASRYLARGNGLTADTRSDTLEP